MYEVVRYLYEGKRITEGKEPIIQLEGEEREYLLEILEGKFSEGEVLKFVKKMIDELESLKKEFLPISSDPDKLNSWLLLLRKKYF